jgi:nucleotidyltransferase/DNA polymerase involved in DNA repair
VDPTADRERKRETIETLASGVTGRASEKNALYKTIGVKIVRPPFEVPTRSRSLPGPVEDPELVGTVAAELLAEFDGRGQATIGEWNHDEDGQTPEPFCTGPSDETQGKRQTKLARFE